MSWSHTTLCRFWTPDFFRFRSPAGYNGSVPFTPSPFSALSSAPFQQALGPLTQTTQGPAGTFGPSPFAYIPAPPSPGPGVAYPGGYLAGTPQSIYRGSIFAMGLPGLNPLHPGLGTTAPGLQMAAAMNAPLYAGAAGLGVPVGLARAGGAMAAGALMWGAGKAMLPALPAAGAAMWSGLAGAFGATSIAGAGASVAGGLAGAGGALLTPALPFLAPMAGLAVAGAGISYGMGGARQFRDVYRASNDIMGGFTGLPGQGPMGRGLGAGAVGNLTAIMQSTSTQAYKNFDQTLKNFQMLASSGELTAGSAGAREMKRNLEKAFDTMTDLMSVLNSTFESAGRVFDQVKRSGIGSKQAMLDYAMSTRVGGGMAGIGTEAMLAIGEAGAGVARQMGTYGAGGARLATGMATAIGAGVRSGAISNELMREISGGTLDVGTATSGLVDKLLGFQQGRGQYMIAGLFDRGGGINKEALQDLISGKLSTQDIVTRGVTRTAAPGGATFYAANKQKMTSQLFEAAGSDIFSVYYQMAKANAEMTPEGATPEMIQILLQQQGLSEAQAKAVGALGGPGAKDARERLEQQSRKTIRGEAISRQRGLGAWWERASIPIREFGQQTIRGPFSRAMGYFSEIGEDMMAQARGLEAPDVGTGVTENTRRDMVEVLRAQRAGDALGGRITQYTPNEVLARRGAEAYATGRPGVGNRLAAWWGQTRFGGLGDPRGMNYEAMQAIDTMSPDARVLGGLSGTQFSNIGRGLQTSAVGDVFKRREVVAEAMFDRGFGRGQMTGQEKLDESIRVLNRSQSDALQKILTELKIGNVTAKSTGHEISKAVQQAGKTEAFVQATTGLISKSFDPAGNVFTGDSMLSRLLGLGNAMNAPMTAAQSIQRSMRDTTGVGGFLNTAADYFRGLGPEAASAEAERFAGLVSAPAGSEFSQAINAIRARSQPFSTSGVAGTLLQQVQTNPELLAEIQRTVGSDVNVAETLQEIMRAGDIDTAGEGQGRFANLSRGAKGLASALRMRFSKVQASPREQAAAVRGYSATLVKFLESRGMTAQDLAQRVTDRGGGDQQTSDIKNILSGQISAEGLYGKSLENAYLGISQYRGAALSELLEGGITSKEEEAQLAMFGGSRQGFEQWRQGLGGLKSEYDKLKKSDPTRAKTFLADNLARIAQRSRYGLDKTGKLDTEGQEYRALTQMMDTGRMNAQEARKFYQAELESGQAQEAQAQGIPGIDQLGGIVKELAATLEPFNAAVRGSTIKIIGGSAKTEGGG